MFSAQDLGSCPCKGDPEDGSISPTSRTWEAGKAGPLRCLPIHSPLGLPNCLTSCQATRPPACHPLATPLAQVSCLSLLYSSRA